MCRKETPKIHYLDECTEKYLESLWQRAIDDGLINPYETDKFIGLLLEPGLIALLRWLKGARTTFAFSRGCLP